jgi:ribose transport system ATP-binding protein
MSSNPSATSLLLSARRITVRYGGVAALSEVDFELAPGEIHGLVGCNGAGKSTLMKVLAGAVPHYEGDISLDGTPVRLDSPHGALSRGIAMVYQELSGVGSLSVAENICLGRQPRTRLGTVDWRRMAREARASLAELNVDIDVTKRLDRYPLVTRQLVEIARGLHSGARILILDEPTSALSPPEAARLFDLMRQLRRRGVSMIFISHFLEDVLAICDRVSVFRDGRHIATRAASVLDRSTMLRQMIGDERDASGADVLEATLPPRTNDPQRLQIQGLSQPGLFESLSLTAAAGECVGLFGFVGAGHQDFVWSLSGAARPAGGTVTLDGRPVTLTNVRDAVRRGIVFVAADRARTLVRGSSISRNLTLAHLRRVLGAWLRRRREETVSKPMLETIGCRPPNPSLRAGSLSGGNQQKVVFGKWLFGPIEVLLLEEPTRGMDVHAKAEIMDLVKKQRDAGAIVVLASTEPELLLAHATRIVVFSRGKIVSELHGQTVTKADLMRLSEG